MNETHRMKHFTKGKEVWYNGRYHTVSHVTVRGYELFVHLDGINSPIEDRFIECELTTFALKRVE